MLERLKNSQRIASATIASSFAPRAPGFGCIGRPAESRRGGRGASRANVRKLSSDIRGSDIRFRSFSDRCLTSPRSITKQRRKEDVSDSCQAEMDPSPRPFLLSPSNPVELGILRIEKNQNGRMDFYPSPLAIPFIFRTSLENGTLTGSRSAQIFFSSIRKTIVRSLTGRTAASSRFHESGSYDNVPSHAHSSIFQRSTTEVIFRTGR